MDKPRLGIHRNLFANSTRSLGIVELTKFLTNSGLFDVYEHDELIHTCRDFRATLFMVDDKRIYFDVWEYPAPTYTLPVFDANTDLIIKLQHKKMSYDEFDRICNRKNILKNLSPDDRHSFLDKIIPWTFFQSKLMLAVPIEEIEEFVEVDQIGFFCGKNWKSRHLYKAYLEKQGIKVYDSDCRFRSGRVLSNTQYINQMKRSKYGIVCAGRGSMFTEAKNRREIDYMQLQKPLLLNYKPHYYNELIEDTHFIILKDKTEIQKLEDKFDIDQIAKNGYQWYLENAAPSGVVRSFFQILKEQLGMDYSGLLDGFDDIGYNKRIKDSIISRNLYNN